MKMNDELVYVIQIDGFEEAKRLYDQLISIPHKHRKKESKELIEQINQWIDNAGGWDE